MRKRSPTKTETLDGNQTVFFQIAEGNRRQACSVKTKFPTQQQASRYLRQNWNKIEQMARDCLEKDLWKEAAYVMIQAASLRSLRIGEPGRQVGVGILALVARAPPNVVLVGHGVISVRSSLTLGAAILSAQSGSGRCSFKGSSRGAVIQFSNSSGAVRITGMAFGWMAPTSAFGSVVRNA